MYAFNITDDLEAMLRHHDTVLRAGGTCVMVGINNVGLAAFSYLRERCQLPIHGAPQRLGHADPLSLFRHGVQGLPEDLAARGGGPAPRQRHPEQVLGVRRLRGALHRILPGADVRAQTIMPVISSGQWGGQAPETYRRTKSVDLMYLAGGGIVAHPGGPAAGVAAIQQAWDAARTVSLSKSTLASTRSCGQRWRSLATDPSR